MNGDLIVGGVLFSPFVPQLVLAVLLTGLLTFVMIRLDLYRFLWSRPLVELALFCIILGAVVALSPDGWSALSNPQPARAAYAPYGAAQVRAVL